MMLLNKDDMLRSQFGIKKKSAGAIVRRGHTFSIPMPAVAESIIKISVLKSNKCIIALEQNQIRIRFYQIAALILSFRIGNQDCTVAAPEYRPGLAAVLRPCEIDCTKTVSV